MRDDFAIIIPSYNRFDVLKKYTLNMLEKYNYDGKWYVVVDDNDPQLEEYKNGIPKEHLFIFNKKEHYNGYDTFYNKKDFNCKLYALDYIQNELVYELNLNFYCIIDDDISNFIIRLPYKNKLLAKKINDIQFNDGLEYHLDFLNDTHYSNVSFCNEMGLFGGVTDNIFIDGYVNKMLSIYLMKVDKPYPFYSIFEEEVNTEYLNGLYGKYVISLPFLFYKGKKFVLSKNRNDGGNSELYNTFTNTKFLELMTLLMCRPNSIIKIIYNNKNTYGFHYNKDYENIYPKIIDGRWKK